MDNTRPNSLRGLLFSCDHVSRRPAEAIEEEVTELFERFRLPLLRYLVSVGMPASDGEDIVQETFLVLFQHLRQQKGRENLRGWLFRVAHNLAIKKRALLQRDPHATNDALDLEERHDPGPTPEEKHLTRQRQLRLRSVLDALPKQDQCCLYLRAEGLRYREIAEILEISLGGVSKSITRAIARLTIADNR